MLRYRSDSVSTIGSVDMENSTKEMEEEIRRQEVEMEVIKTVSVRSKVCTL